VIPRRIVTALVIASLVLPIAICVLLATGRLLAAMSDAAGAAVLDRLGLAAGILWVVGLIGLLIVLAIQSLGPPGEDVEE
jgi:hypothetical protein